MLNDTEWAPHLSRVTVNLAVCSVMLSGNTDRRCDCFCWQWRTTYSITRARTVAQGARSATDRHRWPRAVSLLVATQSACRTALPGNASNEEIALRAVTQWSSDHTTRSLTELLKIGAASVVGEQTAVKPIDHVEGGLLACMRKVIVQGVWVHGSSDGECWR